MTLTVLFIAGVVIVIACVMLDEFLEAYDEWNKDIDDEDY